MFWFKLFLKNLKNDIKRKPNKNDEQRTKQRHVMTHQVYKGVLDNTKSDKKGYYCYDLTNQIKEYKDFLTIDKIKKRFLKRAVFLS